MSEFGERSYWLGFSLFPGIGPGRFLKLLSYFGSAKNAWQANLFELQASKIGNTLAESFINFRGTCDLQSYEAALQKKKIRYLLLSEPAYPQLLKQIKNPPFVLFIKGDLAANLPVAIVGTRKVTHYGREITERITTDLVTAGCVIVSGLATGVDAIAHHKTLVVGGKTIAVLGCGIDCCSPRENTILYNSILEQGGCIVSEYGLGVSPTKGSFPSRNRIIAGLSLGILVTEGAEDSGALITAHDAWKNERKVFAIPGPITSTLSQGTYKLLKKGATLVSSAKEILDELGVKKISFRQSKQVVGATTEEQCIIDLLKEESLHVDELLKRLRVSSSSLSILLSVMEMKGLIKNLGGGFFQLNIDI